jgi:hypothetical protein
MLKPLLQQDRVVGPFVQDGVADDDDTVDDLDADDTFDADDILDADEETFDADDDALDADDTLDEDLKGGDDIGRERVGLPDNEEGMDNGRTGGIGKLGACVDEVE